MKSRINIEIHSEYELPVNELWDNIVDKLTQMQTEGRIENYNISIPMPESDTPASCPICQKLIGHENAVKVHRRLERH